MMGSFNRQVFHRAILVIALLFSIARRLDAQNPAPTLATISPAIVDAGSSAVTITLSGSAYIITSVLQCKGNMQRPRRLFCQTEKFSWSQVMVATTPG